MVDGKWVKWDAEKYGQVNPQTTDSEGKYGWVVPAGTWRVVFTKPGYANYTSENVVVPPPKTDLNIGMVNLSAAVKEATPTGTGVAVNTPVTVTFTKPMESASINADSFIVKDAGGNLVNGSISYDNANNKATFTPSSSFGYSTQYTATVKKTVKSLAGTELNADFTWSFTTVEQPR